MQYYYYRFAKYLHNNINPEFNAYFVKLSEQAPAIIPNIDNIDTRKTHLVSDNAFINNTYRNRLGFPDSSFLCTNGNGRFHATEKKNPKGMYWKSFGAGVSGATLALLTNYLLSRLFSKKQQPPPYYPVYMPGYRLPDTYYRYL